MNKNLNRKGFTLIELLAVIVILAILVMLAIPAVTKYLSAARQGAFSDNAHKAIDAVRTDVITTGFTTDNTNCHPGSDENTMICVYDLIEDINPLLEKKLDKSPFGGDYVDDCYVQVTQTYTKAQGSNDPGTTSYKYEMCLIDKAHNGFSLTEETAINSKIVLVGGAESKCNQPNTNDGGGGGENNGGN